MKVLKSRKGQIALLLLVSLVGLAAGYFLSRSFQYGICYSDAVTKTVDVRCHDYAQSIGGALYYASLALSLIFLLLLAVPQSYSAWKKFAIWFIPLAAFLFIFYPQPGSGDFLSPYPEQVYQWVSALYVLICFVIIVRVSTRSDVGSN